MNTTDRTAFVHCVYFTLTEKTPELRDRLLAACHEHLSDHPGTVHFSAGSRATDYQRPVNDQEFDLALVMVFASEADHDRYQESERHQKFLAEHSECWSQVRVFDAFV